MYAKGCCFILRYQYSGAAVFCSISAELSRFSEEFVCSVVLGDDLIPRLGIGTMEKLKSDMMNALNSCTVPKVRNFEAKNLSKCLAYGTVH